MKNKTLSQNDSRKDVNEILVKIERVGPDVDEDRHRPAQHEGVGRGDEGVRGHDDLVAWQQVGKQRGHLQRRCA